MIDSKQTNLARDLFLPTILFAAMGGMTWAIRGCSGFGGSAGCIFAGVLWGTGWWYIAHEPTGKQTRRYSSGWIILALTVGIGMSGARGWMQWANFFDNRLYTDWSKGEYEHISRGYGFLWLFIAGMPWAGIGACLLAWCGSLRETRIWHWGIRIACGIAGGALGLFLFKTFPQFFLPLYGSLETKYQDLEANPGLRRLINDNRDAMLHMGIYLGFLTYELIRREWKNCVLILTVGIVNGAGWALCQNWKWAPRVWENGQFNWWRCWESSGGISIGIAYGVAYFLVNRRMSAKEQATFNARKSIAGPSLEWLGVYFGMIGLGAFFAYTVGYQMGGYGKFYFIAVILFGVFYYLKNQDQDLAATSPQGDPNLQRLGICIGLLLGLGISIRNGLKGWFNIYRTDRPENEWGELLWQYLGPVYLGLLIVALLAVLFWPRQQESTKINFPFAYGVIWLVIISQNTIGQLVTGKHSSWAESAFSIYYGLLFLITAVIVIYFRTVKRFEQKLKAEPSVAN